jgi:geranylgeranyl transferase type-2 subunit alpha
MHGRKKSSVPPSAAEVSAVQKKIGTYNTLVGILFERRKKHDVSDETLALTAQMLSSSPDFYSLWNYRREILIHVHGPTIGLRNDRGTAREPDSRDSVIPASLGAAIRDQELLLSADGIRKNPKSYGAWHHRLWIIERFECDFDKELELCKEFLRADQRNFHCWNYRRFVAAIACVDNASEFQFSEDKIYENFSNYSAFHHRSVYLSTLGIPLKDSIPSELSIIENAIFTEPDDQSAWWYLNFLLRLLAQTVLTGEGVVSEGAVDHEWHIGILRQQIGVLDSLLEVEADCKWALLALVTIIKQLRDALTSVSISTVDTDETDRLLDRRKECLVRLCDLDRTHIQRYRYLLIN